MNTFFIIFTLIILSCASKAQICSECPKDCKNGTYNLTKNDNCTCICNEDLCNGKLCPPDFHCQQGKINKTCVPNKQGVCPIQELTVTYKSNCLKDSDCVGNLKCCPFKNNTYCAKPCKIMMCKCVADSILEYVLNELGCPVCRCLNKNRTRILEENICDLPKKIGHCRASLSRFFYNTEKKKCENFRYGGCMGNKNNFNSLEDCENECNPKDMTVKNLEAEKSFCFLPSEMGPCKAMLQRHYYNPNTQTCEEFFYGGCAGNKNNFITKDDCLKSCGVQSENTKRLFSPKCTQEKKIGDCRGYFPRYFFNSSANECQSFIYGGCDGNDNNFEKIEECQNSCVAQTLTENNKRFMEPNNTQCTLPPVTGMCMAYFEKYFFNNTAKECQKFIYGGCRGNTNKFDTIDECNKNCYNQNLKEDSSNKKIAEIEISTNICSQEKLAGNCRGYFIRYFYNTTANQCQNFIYGGCNGNENNFQSIQECHKSCLSQTPDENNKRLIETSDSQCSLPAAPGVCYAAFEKYFYDSVSKRCKTFIYGGCQGNENKFDTEEQCLQACSPAAKQINEASSEDNICYQEKLVGNCRGYFEKYFYNSTANECQQFIYGGCNGNQNNFDALEECNKSCKKSLRSSRVDTCTLPVVQGPCRGAHLRFYYNSASKTCEDFIYGGCLGNDNNFQTLDQCNTQCSNF